MIEMADASQAATCVNYHQNVAAFIGRAQVLLQCSLTHKELKTDKVRPYNFTLVIVKNSLYVSW